MSSIFKSIAHIFHSSTGKKVGEVALNLTQHAVAVAKADAGLVGKITGQIEALVNPPRPMTGAEKLASVVTAIVGDLLTFIGDPTKAEADVVDFGRELVQSVFNDAKSATAGVVASLINAKAVTS